LADAARASGVAVVEPLRGWDVSCDARIFAREYPESAVITFGAGSLQHAHSANEQVILNDVLAAAKTVARFALSFDPRKGCVTRDA
jgi:acetylornithine deacetylase/succinyl-diaminopimelate desuccinylase-like protein